jgi:hypothetical protein
MCGFHGELELRQATSWNVARGVQKGWKSVLELALPRIASVPKPLVFRNFVIAKPALHAGVARL